MNKSKKNSGFTLIETILYLALFSIIITGGMVATYEIIQGTDANNNKIILQEEANFLLRKIDWIMTGATATTASVDGKTLTVTKGGTNYTFVFNSSTKKLSLNSTTLNSSIVSFEATTGTKVFVKIPTSNGKPEAITTSFTLTTVQNGRNASQAFSTTKYLRQ